jgi:hypothetical protein
LVVVSISPFWHFIHTFCADKKYQKALRMDAFLTPNEADDFWALRNYRASEQNTSLLVIISERSR